MLMGGLRSVAGRWQAGELEPRGHGIGKALAAITVHAAVQDNRRQALAMRLENAIDHGQVFDAGRALIMDHEIVALGPIGLFVNRVQVLRALIGIVGDRHTQHWRARQCPAARMSFCLA